MEKDKTKNRKFPLWAKILVRVLIPVICGAALVTGAVLGWRRITAVKTEKKVALVEAKLLQCAELTTHKYQYSDIISIKKHNMIAKSYSIIRYSGVIRIGIPNIEDMKVSFGKSTDNTVFVDLPKCEILGNDITEEEIFDESLSVFIPITTSEIFQEIETSRLLMQDKLVERGIIDEADERAKTLVRGIFQSAGFEDVRFK
ncbi:MAG: DUF4230 domain-containing protein [Treponema sp.]|nr:DUF4230 domain-containing protein [Treponema sp.]